MMSEKLNAEILEEGLAWLEDLINRAVRAHLGSLGHSGPYPVDFLFQGNRPSNFAKFLMARFGLDRPPEVTEMAALLLALCPQLKPNLLDVFKSRDPGFGERFSEFGVIPKQDASILLPSLQTLAFLVAGRQLDLRSKLLQFFEKGHFIHDNGLILLGNSSDLPLFFAELKCGKAWLRECLAGESALPGLSGDFPAQLIHPKMNWEDLVLNSFTLKEVNELQRWLKHRAAIGEDPVLGARVKPGFRALFHGPPGTGKTLTAGLLGKAAGLPVFRVDLSTVVSKYIGETEKNLARLFDQALQQDWILFFDEAEALFSKRTANHSSNDRFANQEVAYLLQRLEEFPGLAILATNFKSNIDPAFLRRFQAVVDFPKPRYEERLFLWKNSFPAFLELPQNLDLEALAANFELTGANIINVLHSASLAALDAGTNILEADFIIEAIKKEMRKEDRVFG